MGDTPHFLSLVGHDGPGKAVSDLEDGYNQDFKVAANILFMGDENLPGAVDGFLDEASLVELVKMINF